LTWTIAACSFTRSNSVRHPDETDAFWGVFFVPNIASAKKNMRKSRAATVRNRAQRSALRTALKKARAAGADADTKRQAVQLLDRAARKGLIHRNAAARYKSGLAR
jgi:small subunit ribosomal protein S20